MMFGEDEASLGLGKAARSQEIAPGVLLDLAENGEAIGLELLGLPRRRLRRGQVARR